MYKFEFLSAVFKAADKIFACERSAPVATADTSADTWF